jgi:AcrR family transcriptional regulator
MAHRVGKKEEGRARILMSASRGFRSRGFAGLGVDGIAREAGVTSGAFYAHFPSKTEAFTAALIDGLAALRAGITELQRDHGVGWTEAFIDFYLSDRRTCDLADSCALQSLTAEVARASPETRSAYERELEHVIDLVASGLGGAPDLQRGKATALLSLLSGGVTLARAVEQSAGSDSIAEAVRIAARQIVGLD